MFEANVAALREREPDAPALRRYTEVARLLTGRGDATIDDGVAWLHETVAALSVPPLGAVGLAPEQYPDVAEKAVEVITANARTGQIGDGKIFVTPIDHALRIRTGETDSDAL